MKFSQKWWVVAALLFAFAVTVSFLSAQTEEPSAVDAPSSAEVQSSSDEPGQKQSVLASTRDTASATDVETDRRFNELRRELLDDREKMINWWLAVIAIFLTFLAIIIPIIVLIGGLFSFKKFNEIKDEAQHYVEEIKASRDEADSLIKGMDAKVAAADPDRASDVVKDILQNPDSSLIEQAIAAALSFQQQSRIEEAIEKWRSIANITEGTDDERAAEAWFSVGYLTSPRNVEGEDFAGAIAAYNKAIELNLSGPNLYWAYYNRGNAKTSLGQIEEAIADYDKAIRLNPSFGDAYNNRGLEKIKLNRIEEGRQDCETALNLARSVGNASLMERARRNLEILDRGDAP